jgi:hypothetical protein
MYEIHHAPKELDGDISVIKFCPIDTLLKFIDRLSESDAGNTVYLLTYDNKDSEQDESEVFITSNLDVLAGIIQSGICLFELKERFFIFEYASYEEAYATALNLKESSPLCYEEKGGSEL